MKGTLDLVTSDQRKAKHTEMAATTRTGLLWKAGVSCCVRVGSGSSTEPRKDLDPNGKAKEG